ncbi:hypothetical protein CDAR_441201 [Caerostris darwini]|uniref:Uncharacterized protein n=1 Tax=Caerostris darwini TaxID=1538125 RepID=A0AAV4SE91_9ARAC|nr:hypothetical protein CDAR_441201 [Caerostris darwini]
MAKNGIEDSTYPVERKINEPEIKVDLRFPALLSLPPCLCLPDAILRSSILCTKSPIKSPLHCGGGGSFRLQVYVPGVQVHVLCFSFKGVG